MSITQALCSDAFVESVGINVHFSCGPVRNPDNSILYPAPVYTSNPELAFQAIGELAIRHVRDSVIDYGTATKEPPYVTMHKRLIAAGVRGIFSTTIGMTAATISGFVQRLGGPDQIDGIEYPNEQDNNVAGVKTYSATMASIRGQYHTLVGPSFADASNYSKLGDVPCDVSNIHKYYAGRNPGTAGWGGRDAKGAASGSMEYQMDALKQGGGSEAPWVTETGYEHRADYINKVSEVISGVYTPRLLLNNFQQGIARTYLYELASSPGRIGEDYGLIDLKGHKRPSYMATRALLNLLKDPSPAFNPGSLDFALAGAGQNLRSVLLRKHDGGFYLALWVEAPGWDPDKHVDIKVPPQVVTLHTQQDWTVSTVYQFGDDGMIHTSQPKPSRDLSLTVSDRLQIVKLWSPSLPVNKVN